jgi:hypothetical protein
VVRLRVDLRFGYASFSESEEDRAWRLYEDEGYRIVLEDDEGRRVVVLAERTAAETRGKWDPT